MNKYIIDSSAWIEYFSGTDKGRKVKELLIGAQTFTTGIVIAEVSTHFLKKGLQASQAVAAIKTQAALLPIDFHIGEQSAEIYVTERKTRSKFGLADAHIVATAKTHHLKIITCDMDFIGFNEATVIK